MLDIDLFRAEKGGDPEKVRESQRRRYAPVDEVDEVITIDEDWRKLSFQTDQCNRVGNAISKTIGMKMKAKEPQGDTDEVPESLKDPNSEDLLNMAKEADKLREFNVRQLKALKAITEQRKKACGDKAAELVSRRDTLLRGMGNLVHETVPVSDDEDADNKVERTFGEPVEKKYSHVDLIIMVDGAEFEKASVAAGSRSYYLKGPCVLLEQAIISYCLHSLVAKGYTPLYTPFFMNKNIMMEVAQLSQFDEELYKVTGKASELKDDAQVEEKYLIATSEQSICAYHRDEWISKEKFPIRYAGMSTCFRQEVGSHGRDTRGIFRVHQFEKIEQFVLTSPDDDASWKEMERMIDVAEQLYKDLEIPYRIVNVVSGALNNAAAKKYDLEGWFAGSKAYRELVSCSNCTDYQARRVMTRYGTTKEAGTKTAYCHMLNSTMAALTRVICVILENYQTETGVKIPAVLKPYFPTSYGEEIPFVRPAPIDEEQAAAASKGKKGAKKNPQKGA
eukprot:Clim_evm4s80 gene=Clim_evmTU4s80